MRCHGLRLLLVSTFSCFFLLTPPLPLFNSSPCPAPPPPPPHPVRFDVPSEGGECTKIKTLNLNSVEAAPQTPASYAAAAGADDTDEAAAAMGGES